ncbi:MAG: hypothetical protein JW860_12860 [Sedimentisphaerales bacterium]|nr:hypothetical protein [Sedimentisphaerales bacterium]
MAKEKDNKEDICKKTLCSLVKKNYHQDHPREYMSLMKKAGYLCAKCGRPTVNKKNVCKPVKI